MSLPDLKFLCGAMLGIILIWGIGMLSGLPEDMLRIFYRNSYFVFLGLAAVARNKERFGINI
jgi:hypothetical protein